MEKKKKKNEMQQFYHVIIFQINTSYNFLFY